MALSDSIFGMDGGSGAGLKAEELSNWTIAVLEKVQSRDPLHIPHTWLVHPQERLRPLGLRLVILHTDSHRISHDSVLVSHHVKLHCVSFIVSVGGKRDYSNVTYSCQKQDTEAGTKTMTKALCLVRWASWDAPVSTSHDSLRVQSSFSAASQKSMTEH